MGSHPQALEIQSQRCRSQGFFNRRHRTQVPKTNSFSLHKSLFQPKHVNHREIAAPESEWNASSVKTATCPTTQLHTSNTTRTCMEAPDRVLRRSSRRSRWCITVAVSMVVVAVLVVVITVAVVFSTRRHPRDVATNVLVPLYIYPDPGAWDPLFNA